MIEIKKDGIEHYELCSLCYDPAEIKLRFVAEEGNVNTVKLCAECTYEAYKELHEHHMSKILGAFNNE